MPLLFACLYYCFISPTSPAEGQKHQPDKLYPWWRALSFLKASTLQPNQLVQQKLCGFPYITRHLLLRGLSTQKWHVPLNKWSSHNQRFVLWEQRQLRRQLCRQLWRQLWRQSEETKWLLWCAFYHHKMVFVHSYINLYYPVSVLMYLCM